MDRDISFSRRNPWVSNNRWVNFLYDYRLRFGKKFSPQMIMVTAGRVWAQMSMEEKNAYVPINYMYGKVAELKTEMQIGKCNLLSETEKLKARKSRTKLKATEKYNTRTRTRASQKYLIKKDEEDMKMPKIKTKKH